MAPPTPPAMYAAVAVFSLALAVRLLHLWQISDAPFFPLLIGDARAYDAWAQRIAAGDLVGQGVFYQAPLYPYFLGAIYAVAGRDLTVVRVIQAGIGSLSCVLLMLAGRRVLSARAGIVAGVILAVYPPAVFFDGLIQKTVLDAFLVCLAIWLIARLEMWARSPGEWACLGLAIGALCLTRENALVFAPVVLVWIWRGATLSSAGRARAAGAFLVGLLLVLTPVTVRNYAVGGTLAVTTAQFGPNLYIGNHAGATGMYQPLRTGRGTAEFEQADATELAERELRHSLSPSEVSAYWTRRALEFMATDPLAWVRLLLMKTALLFNRVEVVDTESQEGYAPWSMPLRLLGPVLNFGVLLPLAVLGLWTNRERFRTDWLLPALAGAYAISTIAFYVLARYRYPLVPFVVLCAAGGLTALPAMVDAVLRSPLRQAGVVAMILVAAIASHWPIVSASSMQAVSEDMLGTALRADGRVSESLEHYRRAAALDPTDASPLINLGTALRDSGRPDEAIDALSRAAALRRESGEAHYFLGRILIEQGRKAEGLEHARMAVSLMPQSPDVRTFLGVTLAAQGRFDEATPLFREVTGMTPQSALAHWNLGSALAAMERFDEAVPELEEAVRLDPAHSQAREDLALARQLRAEQAAARH